MMTLSFIFVYLMGAGQTIAFMMKEHDTINPFTVVGVLLWPLLVFIIGGNIVVRFLCDWFCIFIIRQQYRYQGNPTHIAFTWFEKIWPVGTFKFLWPDDPK